MIKIVAVTACPTGIAHTYMAAEMLEKAGESVNDDFMQVLGSLSSQIEHEGNQPELVTKLKDLNREVLRFTMRRNLKAENPA